MTNKPLFTDEELERCRKAREAIDSRFETLDGLHRCMEKLDKLRRRHAQKAGVFAKGKKKCQV